MADHIVSILQMLSSKYTDCDIILGADRNSMDIKPILSCGLRLRQVVGLSMDILIIILSSYINHQSLPPLSSLIAINTDGMVRLIHKFGF